MGPCNRPSKLKSVLIDTLYVYNKHFRINIPADPCKFCPELGNFAHVSLIFVFVFQRSFKREKETSFFQLSEGVTRKQAVSKFYSLLVLAKQEATLLQQNEIFGDVYIRQGPKFESILM